MGDWGPNEIAIAVPKIASNPAAASETQRGHNPRIKRIPSDVSATVAAQAMNGIVAAGMNEFTCAAEDRKFAKCFISSVLSHNPNREATADRNAAPRAMRAYRTAQRS